MVRNIFKAGIGGAMAQLITFAALPVIARMYTPAEYAIWAIVMAIALIPGSVACLRYESALVLPDR